MHIRRLTRADWVAASAVCAKANMEDDLFGLLSPRRHEYPEDFQRNFLRRIRGGSVKPGFVVLVMVTDEEDHVDGDVAKENKSSNGEIVVGYCVWERKGTSPEAMKWKAEKSGLINKIYNQYYTLLNWLAKVLHSDRSTDYKMLASWLAAEHDYWEAPRFAEMWYVAALMVDPAFQRRGIGGKLLEWGLEQAHREIVPAGLEASPKGVGLYTKMGFKKQRMHEWQGLAGPIMLWEPESRREA